MMAYAISYTVYIGIALLLALSLAFALGLALQAERRYGQFLLPSVLPTIAAGLVVSTLLSGRNLAFVDLDPSGLAFSAMADGAAGGRATWPLRLATLVVLASSLALLLSRLLRNAREVSPGGWILIAFLVFFTTNVLAPAALGARPSFVLNHFYPLAVFWAAWVTRDESPDALIRFSKWALLAVLAGSLVAAVAIPSLVLQRPYAHGWIPGLNVRLWGLASHANSIGPLALLYILLATHQPLRARWLHWAAMCVACGVLLFAQSKTAWVALIALLGVLSLYRAKQDLRAGWLKGRSSTVAMWTILAVIGMVVACVCLLLFVDLSKYWNRFADSTSGAQLLSLTGRSQVWDVALEVWRQNPVFGYGPTLWDHEFRRSIGMSFAFSAHNQFLQSLAAAGTVGVLGLILYAIAILVLSLRFAEQSTGFSLALGLFLFLRCITETPLTTATMFNGDFFAHLMIFAVLVRYAGTSIGPRSRVPQTARETRPQSLQRRHPPHGLSGSA